LLLGVGFPGDDNGTTEGIKLTMFDVSDPADLKEIASKTIKADYSPATSNHKAIWVDVERKLIGLQTTDYTDDAQEWIKSYYTVYSYKDGKFKQSGKLALPKNEQSAYVRGVQIGESLYVTNSEGVDVYALDGWAKQSSVSLD